MKLALPSNQSVIVFASYRTGSTALCDYIGRRFNFINFDEAFHPAAPKNFDDITKVHATHPVVIKIMPDHIDFCQSKIDQIRKQRPCTLIRLSRVDVVKQIASYYISSERKIWHQTLGDIVHNKEPYSVDIHDVKLAREIDYIKECNKKLKNLNYRFAFELDYKDLTNLDTKYKIVQRPKNYKELLTTIENML